MSLLLIRLYTLAPVLYVACAARLVPPFRSDDWKPLFGGQTYLNLVQQGILGF